MAAEGNQGESKRQSDVLAAGDVQLKSQRTYDKLRHCTARPIASPARDRDKAETAQTHLQDRNRFAALGWPTPSQHWPHREWRISYSTGGNMMGTEQIIRHEDSVYTAEELFGSYYRGKIDGKDIDISSTNFGDILRLMPRYHPPK